MGLARSGLPTAYFGRRRRRPRRADRGGRLHAARGRHEPRSRCAASRPASPWSSCAPAATACSWRSATAPAAGTGRRQTHWPGLRRPHLGARRRPGRRRKPLLELAAGRVSYDFSDSADPALIALLAPRLEIAFISAPVSTARARTRAGPGRPSRPAPGCRGHPRAARASLAFNGRVVERPAEPVEVVDTLGAGDALIAAVIAAHVRGADMRAPRSIEAPAPRHTPAPTTEPGRRHDHDHPITELFDHAVQLPGRRSRLRAPDRPARAGCRRRCSRVRRSGAWLTDEDGNRYLDYVMGQGPLILGHRPQAGDRGRDRHPDRARLAVLAGPRPRGRGRPRRYANGCRRSIWCGSRARAPRPPCTRCASPGRSPAAS